MSPLPSDLVARTWAHLRARDARPRPAAREDGRTRLRAVSAGASAELHIMDEIGYWGVTAMDVVAELGALKAARDLTVHINSPGGDVFDGVAIYNAIADHPARVSVVVQGLAASAASFIAMAGDRVTMNRGTQLMIHDASGLCIGNASDMAEMVAMLDRTSDTIASMYASRAGGTREDWRALMRAETWYSATEAVAAKLADEAAGGDEADDEPEEGDKPPAKKKPGKAKPDEDDPDAEPAAAARWDLSVFQYAGRDRAPAPPTPEPKPAAVDMAALAAALKGAFR